MGAWEVKKGRGCPRRDPHSAVIGAWAVRVYGFPAAMAREYLLEIDSDGLWRGFAKHWKVPSVDRIRDHERRLTARELRKFARLYRMFSEIDGQLVPDLAPGVRPTAGSYRPKRMPTNVPQLPVDDACVTEWLREWDHFPPVGGWRGIMHEPLSSTPTKIEGRRRTSGQWEP
jgi:hypothetical protein